MSSSAWVGGKTSAQQMTDNTKLSRYENSHSWFAGERESTVLFRTYRIQYFGHRALEKIIDVKNLDR